VAAPTAVRTKIWAHSGDSHFIEPEGLWNEILPKDLAERMPWSERNEDETEETVHIDGESYTRPLPKIMRSTSDRPSMVEISHRPPGSRDLTARMADLNQEGIWGEVVYSSLGLWEQMITDRALVRAAGAAENEWKVAQIQGIAPDRLVAVASLPMLDIDDAIAELYHAAEIGMYAVGMPSPAIPIGKQQGPPPLNDEIWEPLWNAFDDTGMVPAFHIGGDAREPTMYRGMGGAVMNYTNSTYSGQRAAMVLVASGVLDRHPNMKVLISEGGASWVPFLGDRMEEGYRQHSMFVRPELSRSPKEILFEQVYCSFQHEESAVQAMTAMGYNNVMWGSDYPHLEGTFGHTQETLHGLFDEQPDDVTRRITRGAFEDLFPHVSEPVSDTSTNVRTGV
jgi:predicted TIM-barrel fold metal-dependent hydrolase